jgi:hypothetical protein
MGLTESAVEATYEDPTLRPCMLPRMVQAKVAKLGLPHIAWQNEESMGSRYTTKNQFPGIVCVRMLTATDLDPLSFVRDDPLSLWALLERQFESLSTRTAGSILTLRPRRCRDSL